MQLGIESHIPDGLLAENALLAENSRQGVPTSTHALHRGLQFAISSTYMGLQFRCSETASDPVVAPNNGRNCSAGSASAGQYAAASAQVAAMTAQFFSGLGPTSQTFGPGSATSQVMGQSAGVQSVLNSYYMTGQTSGLYTFRVADIAMAGANPVAQFVGSFRWSISGGTLSLANTTSFRSLFFDMGGQWQRFPLVTPYGTFTSPMGNTHQTYQIGVTCH